MRALREVAGDAAATRRVLRAGDVWGLAAPGWRLCLLPVPLAAGVMARGVWLFA